MDITPHSSTLFSPPSLPQIAIQDTLKNSSTQTNTSAKTNEANISGEAQYVFEIDVYLNNLDTNEKANALEFLAKSDNPLHKKALENFNRSEDIRRSFTDETIKSIQEQAKQFDATRFRITERDPTLGPEVALIPNGTAVFRLDGKTDFYPVQLDTSNTKLKATVDALESNFPASVNIQDKANLIGTVRNALYAAESIQLSFDDVLNFNYLQEKTFTTINQTNAPETLKSTLKSILGDSIRYQNAKQSTFLLDAKKYINNRHIDASVKEDLRLGTAAQAYNNELESVLNVTGASVLDSSALLKKLLVKHTDLIRFSQDKVNEAIAFYQQDFDSYQNAIKNGYTPPTEYHFEFDAAPLVDGHNHALKVIEEIQHYALQKKAR